MAIAFNRVDYDRLKLVGPDRLCAEWVLKNGGAVEFSELSGRKIRNYNILPPEGTKLSVKSIDATNSSIMKIGFEHLIGCKKIDNIILHQCKHLEDNSLHSLLHVADTLQNLQISGCYNLTENDLKSLINLRKLKSLTIFDMNYLKNIDNVIKELKNSLPNCDIKTNKI